MNLRTTKFISTLELLFVVVITSLLTISDSKARIIGLKKTSFNKPTILIGTISTGRGNTLYSRLGDWFIWVCILFLLVIIVITVRHSFSRH